MTVKVKTNFRIAFAKRLIDGKIEQAIGAVGLQALGMMRNELNQPGTGREYSRGKDAVHVASAPGESPAPDFGNLKNRTSVEITRTPTGHKAEVIVSSEYALPLHFGTEDGRIKARPFADKPIKGDNLKHLLATFKRFI